MENRKATRGFPPAIQVPLLSFILPALLASPHPATGTAGALAGGSFRSAHDGGDFLEGQVEEVVQHEGCPFGGSQGP
jgi:hypothetical protein